MLSIRFRTTSTDLPSTNRVFKAFYEHRGRPGQRGGSLPRAASPLQEHLNMPKPRMVGIDTMEKALETARKDEGHFVNMLQRMAEATGGEAQFGRQGPIKSRESAQNKMDRKGYEVSQVTDFLRGTVVFDTVDDVYSATKKLIEASGADFLELDDKFNKPTPEGYRDLALKIRTPNGIISEIIVITRKLLAAKRGGGHDLFIKIRDIKRQIKLDKRNKANPEEAAQIKALSKESRIFYKEALDGSK